MLLSGGVDTNPMPDAGSLWQGAQSLWSSGSEAVSTGYHQYLEPAIQGGALGGPLVAPLTGGVGGPSLVDRAAGWASSLF